ncbi:SDR family oxidoreductase [Entomomonas asaccharolytica]|uniref:SDR family oxidoreductase n=1 Tax=Entomomonas asaccharolytica TaxID=2785331 RepID=A0A974NEQ0_9GAMM|nr:SDR family oxidoreductase [Entomomonas asaccharolytica]QQP85122.1 SDR family oxidoreductase [Entomomonas asaccharolytica]
MAKTIFITGCSSGIGLTSAHYLKSLGFRVITSCRKESDFHNLQQQGFEVVLLDLDNSESINQASLQIAAMSQGRLYGLFNNAGFGIYGPLQEISRQQLEQQFATNVFGLHEITNKLLPLMLPHNEGRIVQTSSVMGFVATAGRGAYAASKYAVEGLTDALRLELHGTGIKVSLIEPGPIHTSFSKNVNQVDEENKVVNPSIAAKFSLTADDVMPYLKHAFTHPRPKIRYRITLISKSMWLAKRLLPSSWLDKILLMK